VSESERPRPNRTALYVIIGLALVCLVASIAAMYALMPGGATRLEEPAVLEVTLDGGYADGRVDNPLAELGLGAGGNSLYDVVRALEHAATDDQVKAVRLTVRSPGMGFAQQEEIGQALARVREAGKPIVSHIEADMVSNGRYHLASMADEVWTTPQAFWLVQGLQADVEFYRGTLEKLQVEPDVIMFKEYKSAGEQLLNKEMSEPMREALTAVLVDIQRMWIEGVAERRGRSVAEIEAFVDEGAITPEAAMKAGLVDHFGYRDEVTSALEERLGMEDYESISLGKYLKTIPGPDSAKRIAVVFAEGPISAAEAEEANPFADSSMIYGPKLARDLRNAADADRVEAIVMRVNSPGGSAVGSDLVWREIERAQDQGIPVVVSMSSVAGSGGYWISMGADKIVAHPSTITGSIGVVFTKLNVRGFYEWLGASVDSVKFAENSDLMSPFSSLDEEQYGKLETVIGAMYESFVQKVAEGRGLEFDVVEPLAHGRIWSGEDALQLKLVDAHGGLSDAVALAAELAEVDPATTDVEVFPKTKTVWERLAEGELAVSAPAEPSAAQVRAWVEQLAEPRATVQMPDVRIY